MNKITPAILFWLLLFMTFNLHAESDAEQIYQSSKINHNWADLSQQQYIDNLVACELTVQAHKWSKNIWPEANKKPKPTFSQVIDIDDVRQQVLDTLKMQSVLNDRFNITITDEMLQEDLDRMAFNSNDSEGLKVLFTQFDNNPNTVAQCISRPYLVKQMVQNSYYHNKQIHAHTERLAKTELFEYLQGNQTNYLQAKVNTLAFEVAPELLKGNENLTVLDNQTIKISRDEFKEKIKQFSYSRLQTHKYSFFYTELLKQSPDNIITKSLEWKKISFNEWFQQQHTELYQPKLTENTLTLPAIQNNLKTAMQGDTWLQTRVPPNVPDAREQHTAIWTGNEMIVWGGRHPLLNAMNTGGRYDPVTDSWVSTSVSSNVPSERLDHTVIWTGLEMIVWGGWDCPHCSGDNYLNTGGRYNPINDSWLATNETAQAPEGRVLHSAIWSGTEMIVFGGGFGSEVHLSGGRYNPVTDSWIPISYGADPSDARINHTAVWTGSEMIIWGGAAVLNNSNTGVRYNPATDAWLPVSTIGNVPIGRSHHTAVWTGSDMIIWGGTSDINNQGLSSGGRYHPPTDTWIASNIDNSITGRYWHSVIWTGREMIVWGGNNDSSSGGRYDPVLDRWLNTSEAANVPSGRIHHTGVWTGSEMIIWGGFDGIPPKNYPNELGIYYPYNTYTIGGNLTGLSGGQVILQNINGNNLDLNANGYFEFGRSLAEGSDYDITVVHHPQTPIQTCTVINGRGEITEEVTDILVSCIPGDLIFSNGFE